MRAIVFFEKACSFYGYICSLIGASLLLIVVGHFIIGAAVYIKHTTQDIFDNKSHLKTLSGDKREILPVYDDYINSGEFWKEHIEAWNIHFEPYYHWRRDRFQGKYTNVSNDGVRYTVTQGDIKNAKKIFMFGGSTLWGTGNKDEHTIPSFLQSMLGKKYKIYNYGETAYVSTQEFNYLLYQLAKENVPDAVIFYDGVNDGYTGVYSPAIPRDVHYLRMRYKNKLQQNIFIKLYNASNYKKLITFFLGSESANKWDDEVSPNIKTNSLSVIKFYEAHIKQVKALSKEYGFKAFFFWQPNLFSQTRDGFPYEDAIIQQASQVFLESQRQVYLDAKLTFSNRENEYIFFLGDIFNRIEKPIYIDWCHIGPNGNEIVARWMFDNIKNLL